MFVLRKSLLKKESNILISLGILFYIILTIINRFFIVIPNIVYIGVMTISIVLVIEALLIQKKSK